MEGNVNNVFAYELFTFVHVCAEIFQWHCRTDMDEDGVVT